MLSSQSHDYRLYMLNAGVYLSWLCCRAIVKNVFDQREIRKSQIKKLKSTHSVCEANNIYYRDLIGVRKWYYS